MPRKIYNFSLRNIEIVNENTGFHSQSGQDKFIADEIFINKDKGIFVDIGANDGITFSNTYYFEKELGWTGVAIEPLPDSYKKIHENRNCILVEGCITKKNNDKSLRFQSFLRRQGFKLIAKAGSDEIYINKKAI